MKNPRFLIYLFLLVLAIPAWADSITLKFTDLAITNPSGQTATGSVMAGNLVATNGPLMLKTSNSAINVEIGTSPFDIAWTFIASGTNIASLNGYQLSFGVEANGKFVGTINTSIAVSNGIATATILNPSLVFHALDRTLQLTLFISPNPVGLGDGVYDFKGGLAEVPEPQTLGLVGLGLSAGAAYLRRRRLRC